MENTKMQEAPKQEQAQELGAKRTTEATLERFGGFAALKGFMPAAADMNPARKAAKNIFLSEKRFEDKRKALANELRGWLDILSEDKATPTEYTNLCKEQEQKYQQLLEENVSRALEATHQLETSYRNLDLFFKNAGDAKLSNLRLININREELIEESSELSQQIDQLIRESYDRLSMKDSYGLMVIPGSERVSMDKPTLLKWAKIAHKYKVMMITDHCRELSYEDLKDNTEGYRDSDVELQNVIMTGNWVVGRPAEMLSFDERDEKAMYVPGSGALAGKLYDESANMAQGAGGKKYGTLGDVKGVELDLLKSEIATLMDNQIVPMVYSEGRVMAFNNSTLYNGDNKAMTEYPIVRVFDWVKKVLMNYVHDVALENWDPFNSPSILKRNIQEFLNQYQGYGNLFQKYHIKEPVQDPTTKRISVDLELTPYYATKNFTIKLSADKKDKSCEELD